MLTFSYLSLVENIYYNYIINDIHIFILNYSYLILFINLILNYDSHHDKIT